MYIVKPTTRFKRDSKRAKKRGKALEKLKAVIKQLQVGPSLDPKHRDHPLTGTYSGYRECHIEPDWLLIYRIEGNNLILVRTGTHSDLF